MTDTATRVVTEETAANGAPAGEPDVWNEAVERYNPRFGEGVEPEPVAVSPGFADEGFEIGAYLEGERAKDLLRFSTAGSVDDGKSTLIGRLLYDTQSVYDDQIRSIEGKGTTAPGVLDLALLTDGLRAEREQGITIDVAYRYFSTARRKFIIADTPGHEQYTRNMATGASTADVAVVLVDARKGVLVQSRRHATITALLGVPQLIVAINKMDLVGYAEETFRAIREDFARFFGALGVDGQERTTIHAVPVSALAGDNVVHRSEAMPWYDGPTLLELLETLPGAETMARASFRMPVQRVIRPNLDFRGFAGQIASGTVRPGDRVVALPSGQSSRVERIVTFDGDLEEASSPRSVTLTLADEIDISRGDLLTLEREPATVAAEFAASLVWMDATPLVMGRRYLLKHGSRTVPAQVQRLLRTLDVTGAGADAAATTLAMNGIGLVELTTVQPLAADVYAENRRTGSFVLIDPTSNATVAAGMLRSLRAHEATTASGAVRAEERTARYGHCGAIVTVHGGPELVEALERALFARGAVAVLLRPEQAEVAVALREAGLLALLVAGGDEVGAAIDGEAILLREGSAETFVPAVLRAMQERGVLQGGGAVVNQGELVTLFAGEVPEAKSELRPELLEQEAHVRALLARELGAVAEGEACLTCSFQAEDVLLLKLAMELRPEIPVLFLDTGYHFAETYAYRDRMAQEWGLRLVNLQPRQTVSQQEAEHGMLHGSAPDRCCALRKVEPLFEAVAGYKVWLTGLRREQARSRAALKEVDDFALPSGVVVRKLSPFADWTTRDVWQLAAHYGIPLLPLYERGYTSIGCEPCTSLPPDPNDPRSGRWAGKKVECGIHIQAAPSS